MKRGKLTFNLTWGGLAMFGVCMVLTAGAVNAQLNLIYLLASLLISGFLVAVFLPLAGIRGLRCRRGPVAPPHAGEAVTLPLVLTNRRRRAARFIMVEQPDGAGTSRSARTLAAEVKPGGQLELDCTLAPRPRGVHRVAGLRFSSRAPFGLSDWGRRSDTGGDFVVYPARGRLNTATLTSLKPQGRRAETVTTSGLQGGDFRSLREYEPGDNIRLIHWKSSARLGTLHVREMERERTAQLMMILDSRLPPSASRRRSSHGRLPLERAVSFAAEVGRACLARGSGVLLAAWFPDPKTVRVRPGPGAIERLYELLARLDPAREETADGLQKAARDGGLATAWRVMAVTPLGVTARSFREAFRAYPVELHVADAPQFRRTFTMDPAAEEVSA
jgi:uncharacterized protein (DUF58 family)